MGKIILYHVTGRLNEVLEVNKITPRIFTPERYKSVIWSPQEAFAKYSQYLMSVEINEEKKNKEILADLRFRSDEQYQLSKRVTHTYYTDNLFYLLWKMHKRKIENKRRGISLKELGTIKLLVNENIIRKGVDNHKLIYGSLKNLNKKMLGIGKGYSGLIKLFFTNQ